MTTGSSTPPLVQPDTPASRFCGPARAQRRLLGVMLLYLVPWTAYALLTQWTHYVNRAYPMHDTGLLADLVYRSLVYGEWFRSPVYPGSHLGVHVNPSMFLLGPALLISPSGWGLAWGNVAVAALSALPCALLAWRLTRSPALTHAAVLWLLTNRMMIANLRAVHFELLLLPLVLGALCALRRRMGRFGVLLLLALGVREDVGAATAVFGLLAVWPRRRAWGIVTVALSLAVPLAAALLVLPRFGTPAGGAALWSAYGETWPRIVLHWLTHPVEVLGVLRTSGVPDVFAAAAWLPLLSPTAALTSVASVFLPAMSSETARHGLWYYNSALALPWLTWGLIIGLRRIRRAARRLRGRVSARAYRRGMLVIVLGLWCVPLGATYGMCKRPERDSLHLRLRPVKVIPERNLRIFEYLRRELPREASVATHFDLYPLIPIRRGLTTLEQWESARYVVIDRRGMFVVTPRERAEAILAALMRSARHRLILREDEFHVFEALQAEEEAR